MTRMGARAALLGSLMTAIVLSGCTGCDPEGGDDGGPPTGDAQLAFLGPLNGAVLTVTDDLDTSTDGIQIFVRVHLDPASGGAVKLLVDDTEVASVEPSDGRATFNNVTMTADAAGIEHTLTAEAAGYESDTITVTARIAEATPTCQFLTPVGASVNPPFDVTVSCLLAGANEPATLRLLDADGAQVGAAFSGQLDGNLRFTATGLDPEDGEYTLAFALSNFPATAIEKDITVTDDVVAPDPSCTITAPTAGSPPSTSPTFDVTVECADVPTGVTGVTVALDGPTTAPVTFAGTLAASAGVMTAVVAVTAAEAGSTEIAAEVTNFPGSADVVTVEVPAFPVCDAEILQPADGESNFFDVDPADGNQILVRVGATGSPAACTGATVEVITDVPQVLTGVLGGNSAQSGTATFVVTVPEGESTIRATLALNEVVGSTDTHTITYTTPPVGIRFDGIRDCDGFGQGCFNLSDANQGAGTAYQRTLSVSAPAQNGDCPFTDPLLDVEGHDQDVRADGDTDAAVGDAWTFDNGFCEATFSAVTLHADEFPENVLLTLSLDVALVGGDSETRPFLLGLDRVAPTLAWTTANGEVFGSADDQDTATAILDVALNASVTGMEGRSVLLVETNDLTNAVDTCIPNAAVDASCAFVATLADGDYDLDVVGADAAGNALVNDVLAISVDSNGPCVASISVSADADGNGIVNALEGGTAPITTDVTVTFDAGACAIEDGRAATLLSSLAANAGSGVTSGNAVTFSAVSLGEGTHTLSVQASDAAGNDVAAAGNAADVVVDVSAPSCAIFLPTKSSLNAADDEASATSGLQVSFEIATDGAAARLFVDGDDVGGGAAAGGSLDVSEVTLADGSPSITAECVDAGGNVAVSDPYEPLIDATLPTAAFNAAPLALGAADDTDSTRIGVQTTINVDVSLVEPGRPVAIFLADGGAPTGNALGSATTSTDTTAGGTETVAVPTTFLSCVGCSYVARVTDAAGNDGLSATTTITVTSELYVCTFENPDGAQDPLQIGAAYDTNSDGIAEVSFVMDCPGLPSGSTAELFVNEFSTAVQTISTTAETVTFPSVDLAPGSGQVQVLVDDGTSNGGTDRRDYLVDVEAPVTSWDFTTMTVRLTRNATDGGADLGPLDNQDTAGYQATLTATVTGCDGQPVIVTADGTQVNAGTPPNGGTNPVTLPVSISDGDYAELAVSCSDDVGNETNASVAAAVDTVPPAAPADFTAVLNDAADAVRMGWVDIDFTMPGDDGTSGTVASVALVAAHADVLEEDFAAPAEPFVSIPLTASSTLPISTGVDQVPELWFGPQTWRVLLRATDDVGNVADADSGTGAIELPVATVAFDLVNYDEMHTDDGGLVDRFGDVVSTARGDVDGDGRDDLLLSAWNRGADCDPLCNGALYVLYGKATTADLMSQLAKPAEEDRWHVIPGTVADQRFGLEVATVPSINDDDVDDVMVLGQALHPTTGAEVYAVYVFLGNDSAPLSTTADVIIIDSAATGSAFGRRIAGLGDVNGDGKNDWALTDVQAAGAPSVYIVFGKDLVALDADGDGFLERAAIFDVTLQLPSLTTTTALLSMTQLGNLNGDTSDAVLLADRHPLEDFAIGTGHVNTTVAPNNSRIWVVHGREDWGGTPVVLETISEPDQKLSAGGAGSRQGSAVSAGDINGDGMMDLLAEGSSDARIFLGTSDGGGAVSFSTGGEYTLGAGSSGSALAREGLIAGDLNGDGYDDVVLGGRTAGAWIYLGGPRIVNRTTPDISYQVIADATDGIFFIGAAGDLDGDGYEDIAFTDRVNQTLHLRYGP